MTQTWFGPYDFIAEETFGIYSTDTGITHQETDQKYIVEFDGDTHLEGTEEEAGKVAMERRSTGSVAANLKDSQGKPDIHGILRYPYGRLTAPMCRPCQRRFRLLFYIRQSSKRFRFQGPSTTPWRRRGKRFSHRDGRDGASAKENLRQ